MNDVFRNIKLNTLIANITSNGYMEYAQYDNSGNLIEFKTHNHSSILEWSNGLLMRFQGYEGKCTIEY